MMLPRGPVGESSRQVSGSVGNSLGLVDSSVRAVERFDRIVRTDQSWIRSEADSGDDLTCSVPDQVLDRLID